MRPLTSTFGGVDRTQKIRSGTERKRLLTRAPPTRSAIEHPWGMYLTPTTRGGGAAAARVERVIAQASGRVELIELTVVTAKARAVHFCRKKGLLSMGSRSGS
ncbi:MAG TPA: hypothetical protein VGD78_18780 [Chthoniobacterales bacterium]